MSICDFIMWSRSPLVMQDAIFGGRIRVDALSHEVEYRCAEQTSFGRMSVSQLEHNVPSFLLTKL